MKTHGKSERYDLPLADKELPVGKTKFECSACGMLCVLVINGKDVVTPTVCPYNADEWQCKWE